MANYRGKTKNCLAWKGDVPATVEGLPIAGNVLQYKQDTYWSTPESIMEYIHLTIIPRLTEARKTDKKARFILTLDQAPVHNSFETRTMFEARYGRYGFLVYIPRGCTSRLQPMDHPERFGILKSHVKKIQGEMVVSGSMQYKLLAWDFPRVKQVVMCALASGHTLLSKKKERGQPTLPLSYWSEILKFKSERTRILLHAWTATDAAKADNQLFEYGWPGQGHVPERSLYYTRRRAADNAWDDVADQDEENDLPEEDDDTDMEAGATVAAYTAAEIDRYLQTQSDNEEDEGIPPPPVL